MVVWNTYLQLRQIIYFTVKSQCHVATRPLLYTGTYIKIYFLFFWGGGGSQDVPHRSINYYGFPLLPQPTRTNVTPGVREVELKQCRVVMLTEGHFIAVNCAAPTRPVFYTTQQRISFWYLLKGHTVMMDMASSLASAHGPWPYRKGSPLATDGACK